MSPNREIRKPLYTLTIVISQYIARRPERTWFTLRRNGSI